MENINWAATCLKCNSKGVTFPDDQKFIFCMFCGDSQEKRQPIKGELNRRPPASRYS